MSLQLVLALVLGYVIFVAFVIALLKAAKRGDEAAAREYRALVRRQRRKARAPLKAVSEDDPERKIPTRRAG